MKPDKKTKVSTSAWIYFGVGVLILLLLVWITVSDFWGNADVGAVLP